MKKKPPIAPAAEVPLGRVYLLPQVRQREGVAPNQGLPLHRLLVV